VSGLFVEDLGGGVGLCNSGAWSVSSQHPMPPLIHSYFTEGHPMGRVSYVMNICVELFGRCWMLDEEFLCLISGVGVDQVSISLSDVSSSVDYGSWPTIEESLIDESLSGGVSVGVDLV